MKRKHKITRSQLAAGIVLLLILYAAVFLHPKPTFTNEDFGIAVFLSCHDQDQDGIDDQTDLLQGAKAYLETRPEYGSRYYAGGYPKNGYGVCTDVIAFAMKAAGYDLQQLVDEDIRSHPDRYEIETPDPNIDFRRVSNLSVWFTYNAQSLTTDPEEISQWQGGDIVVFDNHIGMASDARNEEGIPYILHHWGKWQWDYEEDCLERYAAKGEIIGHYRISS